MSGRDDRQRGIRVLFQTLGTALWGGWGHWGVTAVT